jgi:hypothetical protein
LHDIPRIAHCATLDVRSRKTETSTREGRREEGRRRKRKEEEKHTQPCSSVLHVGIVRKPEDSSLGDSADVPNSPPEIALLLFLRNILKDMLGPGLWGGGGGNCPG